LYSVISVRKNDFQDLLQVNIQAGQRSYVRKNSKSGVLHSLYNDYSCGSGFWGLHILCDCYAI